MAAIELSLDVPDTAALSTNAQRFDFPVNARKFRLRNNDASIAIRYAFAGTDGQALPGDYETLIAGALIVLPVPGSSGKSRNTVAGERTIFVASASGAPSCTITAYLGDP